jgi:hypothetical protein
MYPKIKSVKPNDNYILTIVFSSNEVGTLDMKPYLDFGVFKRIKDYANFKSVRVAFDTIEWPSAGVDLDPEFVYQKCKKAPNESLQPDALPPGGFATV